MSHHVKSERVTTRKPHQCWGCQHKTPKGEIMLRCTAVDMGRISSTYFCAVCEAVMDEWHADDREWIDEGGIKSGDPDSWEEVRKEIEDD